MPASLVLGASGIASPKPTSPDLRLPHLTGVEGLGDAVGAPDGEIVIVRVARAGIGVTGDEHRGVGGLAAQGSGHDLDHRLPFRAQNVRIGVEEDPLVEDPAETGISTGIEAGSEARSIR